MGSDHHLVVGKIKIRRNTFVAKLQNRFESLYIEEGIEDTSEERGADQGPTSNDRIEDSKCEDTCEELLRKRREERREWVSEEIWKKIDERGAAKNGTNTAKTRIQMRNAKRKY